MSDVANGPAGYADTLKAINERAMQIAADFQKLKEEWAARKYSVERIEKNEDELRKGLEDLKYTWIDRRHLVNQVPALEARINELSQRIASLEGQISRHAKLSERLDGVEVKIANQG
jgi:predicted  nucleic acid-binding Zn-ribbon protein